MIRTRLSFLIFVLLAIVVAMSIAIVWSVDRVQYLLERSRVAHEELTAHAAVADAAGRYFGQLREMAKDASDRPGVMAGERELRAALARLEELTRQEVVFLEDGGERDEEIGEIERVAKLVATVERLIAARRETGRPDDSVSAAGPLEDAFWRQIDAAMADEATEARRAGEAARVLLDRLVWSALAATAIGLIIGLGAVVLLECRVRRPVAALMTGVRRLADGAFDHRIGLGGPDEFARLGRVIDDLAARLRADHDRLTRARAVLEATVEERTAELEEASQRLRETDALRQRFLADISHELRTPITVIRGEADVALRGRDKASEVYREALRRIVEQAAQLARLVDDLLTVARAKAGAVRLDLGAVPLGDLLEEVCGDAAALAAGQFEVELAPISGNEVVARGDRGRLCQLFMILLDNAVRYAGPGGRVEVRATGEDGVVKVTVVDSGPGMAPEDVANAFERFYRGDVARRLWPEGAGLGLPVAKAIAEAHGGEIRIESALGQGTTVTVTLPRAAPIRTSAA